MVGFYRSSEVRLLGFVLIPGASRDPSAEIVSQNGCSPQESCSRFLPATFPSIYIYAPKFSKLGTRGGSDAGLRC
jgi:hypothetical protein